jgi:uncharacterized protein
MEFIWAAIMLGVLGSFHCIGMCGPIALALPIGKVKGISRVLLVLSYNAGRILTYAVFGLIFGMIGKSFILAGSQQTMSIIAGVLILTGIIFQFAFKRNLKINGKVFSIFYTVRNALSRLFLKNGHHSLFLIGVLNGLLPCGLVYMAAALAVTGGDPLSGAAFMSAFGLGTLPAMLLLPMFGDLINLKVRNNFRKAVPVFLSCVALMLILRGLNLGIPYLSPKIENGKEISCSHRLPAGSSGKSIMHCTSPDINTDK